MTVKLPENILGPLFKNLPNSQDKKKLNFRFENRHVARYNSYEILEGLINLRGWGLIFGGAHNRTKTRIQNKLNNSSEQDSCLNLLAFLSFKTP